MAKKVYGLRTCAADMSAHGGFVWPESGRAEAPDWSPEPVCGQGLHALLRGEGNAGLLDMSPDAKWLVVCRPDNAKIIDLSGKVKAPWWDVVYCGDRDGAVALIQEKHPGSTCYAGTATAGYAGTATAGYAGTATAGARGTATAGYAGTATAGYAGTATAGYAGTATAGARGIATAGYAGTATAGVRGEIRICRWDSAADRYRTAVGYIGEDGLAPGKPYRLDENGKFFCVDSKVESNRRGGS